MKTEIGKQYCVTCDSECEIVDTATGNTIHTHHAGEAQSYFTAIGIDSVPSDDAAVVTEVFKSAPAGNGSGGYIESDLNVGHGAADAVAAVCTLTLGDLAQGGTLADSNGQSVELDAPHAYATGHVDIADATEAGTITFGEHDAIVFEDGARVDAHHEFTPLETYDGSETPYKFTALAPNKSCDFTWDAPAGSTLEDLKKAINDEDGGAHWSDGPPNVRASLADGKLVLWANISGSQGNGYKVIPSDNTPFELAEEFTFTNGQDTRSPQDVVDTLNDSEDCPAVAVLAHVEAQDAKAVFTPLEGYEAGTEYKLSIMEDGEKVNWWTWQAQEGDGVQELVASLNGESGYPWYFTPIIEASLEDGKVVLRKLDAHGAASNGYSVSFDDNPPFEESEETPIQGGRDAYDTITLTAKEYGVNDTITITGDLFENADGMSGGHGDYTVDELLEAIGDEFTDITAAEGSADGTITLTANTAGKAANTVTYTATGCFGSGTVRQGSTTHGKDAVAQTAYQINLNGAPLDVEPAPLPTTLTPTTAMRNSGVYLVTADATAQVYTAITLAVNATAEIWLTCTSDDNSVALPGDTQGWIWLDPMPTMAAGKTYAVAARNVGNAVLARPIYEYTTPTQS